MQGNHIFSNHLEKIDSKLAFLNNALSYELSQDQKDWIQTQLKAFTQLADTIKGLDKNCEYTDRIAEDLYNNLRNSKYKIISWLKFNITDVQAFKENKKRKGQGWVSVIDNFSYPQKLAEIKDVDLCDINFPCLSYTNQELCQVSEKILIEQKILNELNISSENLSRLVEKICGGYNVPAYHNFSHGFNVFQTLYFFIKKTETQMPLDKIEKFGSLIGALGHDLNHKGYNNAYEIKVRSENSIRYYDNAPLENMHASTLIRMLKDPEINFFSWFAGPQERIQFQEMAVAVILATDMSRHSRELQKFTNQVKATLEYQKLKAANEPISKEIEEKVLVMDRGSDKKKILKQVVHACDFTNTCQNYENYMYWTALLTEEFDYQAKKEEKKGIEVSGFMIYKDATNFYAGQIGFTKCLSLPLWEQVVNLFGSVGETVQNIHENLRRLEEDKKKAEGK